MAVCAIEHPTTLSRVRLQGDLVEKIGPSRDQPSYVSAEHDGSCTLRISRLHIESDEVVARADVELSTRYVIDELSILRVDQYRQHEVNIDIRDGFIAISELHC